MINNQLSLTHLASIAKSQPSKVRQPSLTHLAKSQPSLT